MTNQSQEAARKLLDFVTQTVDFSKDQMPDVVPQLLVYDAKIALFWLICCSIIAVIFMLILVFATIKNYGLLIGYASFIMLLAGVYAGGNYRTLIKIETAPKLYVMDELQYRIYRTHAK